MRSALPNNKNENNKKFTVKSLATFIESVFSYKGSLVLGFVILLTALFINWDFWVSVLVSFGVTGFTAWFIAGLISLSSSVFECLPTVHKFSRKLSLERLFAVATKPNSIPNISESAVPDKPSLVQDYRLIEQRRSRFFSSLRWVAYFLEVLLGVIFLGRISTGLRGLFELSVFLFSVAGVEASLHLVLRSAEEILPTPVQEKLDSLIDRANNSVDFTEL